MFLWYGTGSPWSPRSTGCFFLEEQNLCITNNWNQRFSFSKFSQKEFTRTVGATGFELNSLHNVDHQSPDTCSPLGTYWGTETWRSQRTFLIMVNLRMFISVGQVPRYAFSRFFFSVSMNSSEAALIFWTHAVLNKHTHTHTFRD